MLQEDLGRIANDYGGDAAGIWRRRPSSAEIVYRFLQFRGSGVKIATMATNLLARRFKVKMADYCAIDISPDVHVRHVLQRLGLVPRGASNELLICRARGISSQYPGLVDAPTWQIGRQWCKSRNPLCHECYMGPVCPSSGRA